MDHSSRTSDESDVWRCPRCGETMDVRPMGLLRKRRAVCPHCGTSQDLSGPGQSRTPAGPPDTESGVAPSSPEADSLVEGLEHQLWMTQVSTEVTRQDTRVKRRLGQIPRTGRHSVYNQMRRDAILSEPLLSPQDVIRLAGGAIPAEDRRRCPACDAVVSKDQARCEWCGIVLTNDEVDDRE